MRKPISKAVDKLIFLGILAAVIIVPLIFFIGEQNKLLYNLFLLVGFTAEEIGQGNQNIVLLKPLLAQFIMFTLFAFWMVEALETGKFELEKDPLNIPISLLFGWIVITALFMSNFWHYSIEELGRYLAMFLMFFMVQRAFQTKKRIQWGMWVLFAACIYATGIGFFQYWGMSLYDWGRNNLPLISTFGNQNFFAGFLLMTTPVITGYIFATKKWAVRIVLILLALTQFYLLIGTGTRTGVLGFLAALFIFGLLALRFIYLEGIVEIKKEWLIWGIVGFLLVLVAVYIITPEGFIMDVLQAFDLQMGTSRVRWIMWTGSTRAALDSPVAGHGNGVFQLVFPNYRPTFYHRFRVSHNTRHSHNEYMEILMEDGVVGLALFLTIMVSLGIFAYRFLLRNRDRFYAWLTIGLLSGVSAGLVQNLASVNLRWMSSTFTFWFILSLVCATIRVASGKGRNLEKKGKTGVISRYSRYLPELSWKTPFHLIIISILAFCGYEFYKRLRGDFNLKRMNMLIQMAEADRVDWNEAEAAGEKALGYSPHNMSTRYKLGYIYLSQGRYEEAGRQYEKLTDLAPNYAQIHNNIALIERNLDNPYRSLLEFEWATRLEDNLRNHLNLIQNYNKQNFDERLRFHSLYMPRIERENWLSNTYIQGKHLTENNYRGAKGKKSDKQSDRDQRLQALRFASESWYGHEKNFADLLTMWNIFTQPFSRRTLQAVARLEQQEQKLNPLVGLGLVSQFRGEEDRRAAAFRQQYYQLFSDKTEEDDRWRLAAAELLGQMGEKEQARQLVKPYAKDWREIPRFQRVLEFIENEDEN
ncbi:MAG: O-antigen ligase family protein [bacterium]